MVAVTVNDKDYDTNNMNEEQQELTPVVKCHKESIV